MKKIVFVILILLVVLAPLISCGNGETDNMPLDNKPDSNPADDNIVNNPGEEPPENDIYNMKARENVQDGLPEKDFGGADFTILQRTEWNYEFFAESENGEKP